MDHYSEIRDVIAAVRRRWLTLRTLRAVVRAALLTTAVVGAALLLSRFTTGAPRALAGLAAVALAGAAAAVAWALAPLRKRPADAQVARFIEERVPELDDRLVTAVEVGEGRSSVSPLIAVPLVRDAAQRATSVDLDAVIPGEKLRRAGFQAAAAALACLAVLVVSRHTARQAYDAASLTFWPNRVALQVTPGNARVKAGVPLALHARLVGNRAPVIAQVQFADGDAWRTAEMAADRGDGFRFNLETVSASFKYRIVAGAVTSPTYEIAVVQPPRVARIDVDYSYPAGLKLPPRSETDGGDIYAPAGTGIRLHVITDRPAATGRMALGDGKAIALSADKPTEFVGTFDLSSDNSYRVALADGEGMSTVGDTEYFIRVLEDRPPEVRIVKPAADRSVTRLEEVDLEVQAEDDYGVDRVDLVYQVPGAAEKIVPLSIARKSQSVNGRHTLFLEELNVRPGDVVSYYARARDLTTHGARPNEARSDIFFLEVKPYEQEFALAQSQGGMAGASRTSLDELVTAQKEVVVATWKLDRRGLAAKGAKSEQDIKSVSRAEAELQTRVEETSSTFRESTMRDPRRRQPRPGQRGAPPPGPEPLKAGEVLPEEDDMTAAAEAMGKAVTSLDALKTGDALPPELEALNRLLKAQAAVKKREVTQQQAGNGSASNHSNYDLSTLFDRELQKAQQTNYETKSSAEQRSDPNQSALDKIKDLARRQDELLKKQQELARDRDKLSEEQLKRELEKLTREQSELRQRAEELARQTAGNQNSPDKSGQPKEQPQTGQQANQNGQQNAQSQSSQSGRSGQSGKQGQSGDGQSQGGGDASNRMRDASEEMRAATSDMRRQDSSQAAAAGNRALQRLREAQRELEAGAAPDDRRRAVGDLQLEARQLADAERQVASELGKAAPGDAGKDAVRRLAGEQERLATRARKLEDSLREQGARSDPRAGTRGGRGTSDRANAQAQAAAGEAAKEIGRQKLPDRMQQSADALRQATTDPRGARGSTAPPEASTRARGQMGAQQDLARSLDRIADSLAAGTNADDAESKKLSDQIARAQQLRDRLAATGRDAGRQSGDGAPNGRGGQSARASGESQAAGAQRGAGEGAKPGEGTQGSGGSGPDANRVREESMRQLQETKDLIDQIRRDDPSLAPGSGLGFTFEEANAKSVTAPGTEAFKQDFAKWEELRRQATLALENLESSLAKKLQSKRSKDRLAAGADDKAPPEYKQHVDSYFKAIARKKP